MFSVLNYKNLSVKLMANFIKSKIQQSLSFVLILVVAFSAFSGILFVNPSPSYAFKESDFDRVFSVDKDLSGADLSGADLSKAHLFERDLSRANLRGANLLKADLSDTNLRGANLLKADLSGADLRDAGLYEADLSEANLRGTNLRGADLSFAKLSGAIANGKTKFPDGFDAEGAGVIFN